MVYVDVFPTLMEIAGYNGKIKNELDGVNVLKGLQGKKLADRKWFTYIDQNPQKIERFALNTDKWKLVWDRNAWDNEVQHENIELFRIGKDRTESIELSENKQDIVESLKLEIEKYYKFKADNQNPRFKDKTSLSGEEIPQWQPIK